jgi:hypothetical protein
MQKTKSPIFTINTVKAEKFSNPQLLGFLGIGKTRK